MAASHAATPAQVAPVVRPATVAGRFYPAGAAALARLVDRLVAAAPVATLPGARALLAPHAGYPCSGSVAAAAYAALQGLPPLRWTVYLLGPAHYLPFAGAAGSSAAAFATPLGDLPVDAAALARLQAQGAPVAALDAAHAPEHCLEVQLPFLQRLGLTCAIVPLLLATSEPPAGLVDALAAELAADPATLLIVSSDLSHYHPYAEAYARDRALLEAIVHGSETAAAAGEACGLGAICTVMAVARRLAWHARPLVYLNSGDTCGARDQVVGYGALAWTADNP